ncbi:MAG: RidA family protein [Phycisphaerae bacterium]
MSDRQIYRGETATVTFTPVGTGQLQIAACQTRQGASASAAAAEAYSALATALSREGMQPVHERIFGSIGAVSAIMDARRAALAGTGHEAGPVTYIQGRPLWGEGFTGYQVHAVRPSGPDDVWTIRDAGGPVGRGWRRGGLKFLMLHNIHGRDSTPGAHNSQTAQAKRMIDNAQAILKAQGASYKDVARTWIYLSRILEWYGLFNGARNERYTDYGLMGGGPGVHKILLPASTGIEGDNPMGAACAMDVLAVVTDHASNGKVVQMTNVRQQDAFKYGSAFSRGACIADGDVTFIQISGTAAIDEQGKSLFPGDIRRQIHRTLDNIEALIAQKGATLADICNATIFLKRPEDAEAYWQVAAERKLKDMPGVPMIADVCRDDLLFEIDGVAAIQA